MAIDYGQDISTLGPDGLFDLDPHFRWISGNQSIAQCLARALMTRRGTLDYAPDDGIDIRDYLSFGFDLSQLYAIEFAIQNQALRDDRIVSCNVVLTIVGESLLAKVNIIANEVGPFSLVLSIDKVGVAIQSVQ